jgi:hypothetical protein
LCSAALNTNEVEGKMERTEPGDQRQAAPDITEIPWKKGRHCTPEEKLM